MRAIWQTFGSGTRMLAKASRGSPPSRCSRMALRHRREHRYIPIFLRQVVLKRLPVPHHGAIGCWLYSPGAPKQGANVSSDEFGRPRRTKGQNRFRTPDVREFGGDRNSCVHRVWAAKDTFFQYLSNLPGKSERAARDVVSGNYFETLGVNRQRSEEPFPSHADNRGSERQSGSGMLSNGYWKSRFRYDPAS